MCGLGDTLHDTAGNGVGVSVMLSIGDECWQSLTGVFVDGSACVLHMRTGVQC
jgi:hypothetical protein